LILKALNSAAFTKKAWIRDNACGFGKWLAEALLLNKKYPDQLTSFRVQLRREVILGIPKLQTAGGAKGGHQMCRRSLKRTR
jgi:hypothetical protein